MCFGMFWLYLQIGSLSPDSRPLILNASDIFLLNGGFWKKADTPSCSSVCEELPFFTEWATLTLKYDKLAVMKHLRLGHNEVRRTVLYVLYA